MSFVGYAMISDLLPVWGNALVVSAYLSSRANSNLKWYQREMPLRIPTCWRRLVPFDRSPVIEKFLVHFENAVDDAGETEGR